tara:strand:+ start:548 stop:871 length:324 start_codon:yes stop_codon:yes gene_type:complete
MTFAPGWTQEIRPEKEREDLMCYISDTFKAVNGFRPRYDHTEDTIEDLRAMANSLQDDVVEAGIREEKRALQKKRDKSAHRAAMKYYTNLKPRNDTLKFALLDALEA